MECSPFWSDRLDVSSHNRRQVPPCHCFLMHIVLRNMEQIESVVGQEAPSSNHCAQVVRLPERSNRLARIKYRHRSSVVGHCDQLLGLK